jgi:hypothetical protein
MPVSSERWIEAEPICKAARDWRSVHKASPVVRGRFKKASTQSPVPSGEKETYPCM